MLEVRERKGRIQRGRGEDVNSESRGLELKIPPPVVALVVAALMWGMSRVSAPMNGAGRVRYGLAGTLFVVGVLCAASAAITFRRRKTTINPHKPSETVELVRSGPFRWTRNPMYLGLLTVLVSWAVWLSVVWTLIGPLAFVIYIQRYQIGPEERILAAKFGGAFEQYRREVRRWV